MSFLGFLHEYGEGNLIKSSDWDDELNQLVSLFGSSIAVVNGEILIKDQTTGSNNPILKLENLSAGNILELINNNATLSSFIRNNGQIDLGAAAVPPFIISSTLKCRNLNADLLSGNHAAALETKLYSHHSFQMFWDANDLLAGEQEVFPAPTAGAIITKLKAKQEGVASADAVTTILVRRFGYPDVGSITINGNTTAVQTNDVADVVLNAGDVLDFVLTAYAGGTKHTNITVSVHYKNKYTL